MTVPSVIALPLAEAREVLEEARVRVAEVLETRPPGGQAAELCREGPLRVVRERYSAEGAHLVVAAAVPLPAVAEPPMPSRRSEEGSDV